MAITTHRGKLVIDLRHTWPDGRRERLRIRVPNDMMCSRKAAAFERTVLAQLREGIDPRKEQEVAPPLERVHVPPTFAAFSDYFINTYCQTNNRPSTVREKRRALGRGLLEHLGELRLDHIGPKDIEAFKARRLKDGCKAKTINEELAIRNRSGPDPWRGRPAAASLRAWPAVSHLSNAPVS